MSAYLLHDRMHTQLHLFSDVLVMCIHSMAPAFGELWVIPKDHSMYLELLWAQEPLRVH